MRRSAPKCVLAHYLRCKVPWHCFRCLQRRGGAGFRTWNFFGVWYVGDRVDLFIENVMLPIILLDPDQIMD